MVEGFWLLRINGPQGDSGGGVAIFVNGKIFGGDNGFSYVGSYIAEANTVKARVLIQNFDKNVPSIFDVVGDYEMHVSASLQGEGKMIGTAILAGQPQLNLGIILTKRANL